MYQRVKKKAMLSERRVYEEASSTILRIVVMNFLAMRNGEALAIDENF